MMRYVVLLIILLVFISACTSNVEKACINDINEEPEKVEECTNHYLTKFGISKNDVIIEDVYCNWTPNDKYSVVDYKFKTQIKDKDGNRYNIFYKKGCCHRHGYHGFTVCVMGDERTQLFNNIKSKICSQLNNHFGDFTTKCINGEFEKKQGSSTILSLTNDYIDGGFGSDIKTVAVKSSNCLDIF